MSEIDWMYDSLTERFGESLGDRQKVVDALLIAKAVAGDGALGSSNHEGIISVARFILDEWGKYSDAEDPDVLLYSDLDRIRTGELDVSPDDVWASPDGDRFSIRGGKFFLPVYGNAGHCLAYATTIPNEKSFPLTKEN